MGKPEHQDDAQLVGLLAYRAAPLLDRGEGGGRFLFRQVHYAIGGAEGAHLGRDEPAGRSEGEQCFIGTGKDWANGGATFACQFPGLQNLEDLFVGPGGRSKRGFGGEFREANDITQFMGSGVYKAGIVGFAQEFVQAIDMVVVPM